MLVLEQVCRHHRVHILVKTRIPDKHRIRTVGVGREVNRERLLTSR